MEVKINKEIQSYKQYVPHVLRYYPIGKVQISKPYFPPNVKCLI